MGLRKIIRIDEEKCDGCGQCVTGCAEGALAIVDGKARLVRESFCDGLGACIGRCPQDALTIEEREADEFDEEAVKAKQHGAHEHAGHSRAACPGAALMAFGAAAAAPQSGEQPSALRQWPVQLHLVPAHAPFLNGADLLLAADCVPFALANFHGELLAGRRLLVGCPKLDDVGEYLDKLTAILRENDVRSLTVAHMEVPCCHGLVRLAQRALEASGKDIPLRTVQVSLRGQLGRALERATV